MRSLAFVALAFGTLSAGQTPFTRVELQSNVLAVGEVSSVRIAGGSQPYSLSFLLRGETKEIPIAEAKSLLIGQLNKVRSSEADVLIEFKPVKPFKGALIVRDAAGREAKFDLYCGDEKLLRDFGKSSNPR
jgi:hypothetical protein